MKNRLQALWDQVSPEGGPCPQPDAKAVRRRVDAALDAEARPQRRPLRAALVLAAALALLAVQLGGRYFLVGSSPSGFSLVAELTAEEGELWSSPPSSDSPAQDRPPDFTAILRRFREKK